MWNVTQESGGTITLSAMRSFTLPAGKQRWVAAGCILQEEDLLICGDRGGSVHIYQLDNEVKFCNRVGGVLGVCVYHPSGGCVCVCVQGGCVPGPRGRHPPCGQTDTCENITLPQTSFADGNYTLINFTGFSRANSKFLEDPWQSWRHRYLLPWQLRLHIR